MTHVWKAHRLGWFTHRYAVEERGAPLATLVFGWGTHGTIELGERRLAITRSGFWKLELRLLEQGRIVASAGSAGAFRRGFYLVHGEEEYRLDPSSWLGGAFDLTDHGRLLGRIRAVGLSRRSVHLELDEELAPEVRLFAFWLVVFAWRRAAAAAGAFSTHA
jgi:hypothetical protein